MGKCLFAYPDKILNATLSGGSWQTSMPLNNLKDSSDVRMSTKARSVDASESATQFLFDLGSLEDIRVIALLGHNASKTATFDISLTATPAGSLAVLPNPATLPTGIGAVSTWSPDGAFLAVGHDVSPFLTIYQKSGTTLTKLANPATLPTAAVTSAMWSPDDGYLAVIHDASPYLTVYQVSGTVFTKLANPSTLPTGTPNGLGWHPSSGYLAVAHDVSPYVSVYTVVGTTLTKRVDATTLPTGSGACVAWSTDGGYFAVGHDVSPYLTIDTITGFATLTANPTGIVYGVSWSPTGEFLAVAHDASPYLTVYQASGATFTKLANPATLPTGTAFRASWSPTGEFLAVAHDVAPYLTIYQKSGTTLTKLANPSTLPPGTAWRVVWSPTGEFLAVAHDVVPYLTVYRATGAVFDKLPDPATLPAGLGAGVSWSPDSSLLAIAHDVSPFITVYQSVVDYYQTGIPFYTTFYPAAGLPSGHPDALTGGTISDADIDIYPRQVYVVLTAGYSIRSRYGRIAIHDTGNIDGNFELSRCIVAPAWQPSLNMQYGASFGWESATQADSISGGSTFYYPNAMRRVVNLELFLPTAEALCYPLWVQRKLDINGEMFFIFDPDATTMLERMQSFLCTMRELSPLEYTMFNAHNVSRKLLEVL